MRPWSFSASRRSSDFEAVSMQYETAKLGKGALRRRIDRQIGLQEAFERLRWCSQIAI